MIMKRALSLMLVLAMLVGLLPMTAFASETKLENPWSGKSAVFVGDSITAGVGTEKIYYQYLNQNLGIGSVTAMGVAGSCISAASDYGQNNQPLINRYQSIPSADLIVIFMGTNDYGHETPLGSKKDTQDGTFYGALNTIIPALVAKHTSSKIVFVTPMHRYGFGTSGILGTKFTADSIPNGVGATLGDYVNALKSVCASNGVSVIDLYTECTLDPADDAVRTIYMPDGLHPNAVGHELIAGIMESHIRSYSPVGNSPSEPEKETELVYGNKFAAGYAQENRASSRVNQYLKAGTVITLKEPAVFQWACTRTSGENSTDNQGYFPDSAWSDKNTAVVEADGWVGFVFKYRDESCTFDLTKPLSDYISIEAPHVHSYESVVTPPTFTEQGYTTYTCECGNSYVGDYTDVLASYKSLDVMMERGSVNTKYDLGYTSDHYKNYVRTAFDIKTGGASRLSIEKLDIAHGTMYVQFFASDYTKISSVSYVPPVEVNIPDHCDFIRVEIATTNELEKIEIRFYDGSDEPREAKRSGISEVSEKLTYKVSDDVHTTSRLILPPNYSIDGEKVPLILWLEGSGSSLSTWGGDFNSNKLPYLRYLRDEGFAVFSVYAWGNVYAEKYPKCGNSFPYPIPTNLACIKEGIDYVCSRYNIDADNIHIMSKSQGGQSALYYASCNELNVKTIGMFAPVLDYLSMPGEAMYKDTRAAIADDLDFTGDVAYFASDRFLSYSDEGRAFLRQNLDKLMTMNEAWTNLSGATAQELFESAMDDCKTFWTEQIWKTDRTDIYTHTDYVKTASVPVKIWGAKDDAATPYLKMVEVVQQLKNGGSVAELVTLPNGTGGHSCADVGSTRVNVTTELGIEHKNVPIGWVENVQWIRSNGEVEDVHTHSHTSIVTAPTCTEQGYTTYTCECGDSYVDDDTKPTGHQYQNITCVNCGESLAGKTVSILSHSISTYAGVSNNTAYNSTIGNNDVYYTEGRYDVYREDTWWQQVIDALGMELLVNNSWSGSCIYQPRKGEASVGYGDRAVNLHNDHTGEEPDVILVYLGCNDFAYFKDTFGKAMDVDYAALIQDNGDGTFTYAAPKTACEAYAIMLHKVQNRYPDAEVYCMTSTARRDPDYADTGQPTAYSAQLHRVAKYFGFTIIDLENCIPKEAEIFDQYIGDKRAHPNTLGMDKITNEVLSVMLGRNAEICHVNSEDGTVKKQAVLFGGSYNQSVELAQGYSAVVTMGGKDVTEEVFDDGRIYIEKVTGDITVRTVVLRDPLSFRWEVQDAALTSVGEERNALDLLTGSIKNGVMENTIYEMENHVVLKRDLPWELECQFSGDWRGCIFSTDLGKETAGKIYLTRTKGGQLCFGTWTGNQHDNYGVDLSNLDDKTHTYRLVNRIAADGDNMIWLYVDNAEIGPMNNYFVGSNKQNKTSNWLSGKDFVFSYIGMDGHALRNCRFTYLQVRECVHNYENGICIDCRYPAPVASEQMTLRYDDHVDMTGKSVQIVSDKSVVSMDNNYLVATGIGTALVRIDGVLYQITVEKAKVNLVMIMGQSNAGNHFANAASDVTCPIGTAYWWGNDQGTDAAEPVAYTQTSLGFHTPLLAELYAQSEAAGDPVKNVLIWQEGITSKNGQSIVKWAASATDTSGTDDAVTMLNNCRAYYEQHSDLYEIVSSGVYWLQGESDTSMDPALYTQRFLAMWGRLKEAGMEYVAFLRVRRATSANSAISDDLHHSSALSAQIRLINEHPEFYMATTITENWVGAPGATHTVDISRYITMVETYGKQASYSDTYGNNATYADGKLTTTMKSLYGSNNTCHYGKFGYGIIGADAAYNMYRALHTKNASIVVTDTSGYADHQQTLTDGQTAEIDVRELAYNISFRPGCGSTAGTLSFVIRSAGADITNAEGLILSSGEQYGSVSVSKLREYEDVTIEIIYTTADGTVYTAVCNVLTPPREPKKDYIWNFNHDLYARSADGEIRNALLETALAGSYTLENGCLTAKNLQMALENAIELEADKNWTIEWKYGSLNDGLAGFLLCENPGNTVGNKGLWHTKYGNLTIADYRDSLGYRNYTSRDMTIQSNDRLKLVNQYDPETGKSTISLWVNDQLAIADFQQKGSLNDYHDNLDMTSYPLSADFTFRYLGNTGMADWYVNCQIDYLKISFGETEPAENSYAGKVISVLGDSISTFAGYIPTADGFNLEHLARYPQDDLLTDVNETWWMQIIDRLDAKLGINDSWRGATVSGYHAVTTGSTGENAAMGNLQRIRNLGANGTPDVILFYGGTNDLAHVSKVGSFDPATAPNAVDLVTKKWDNLADGYVNTLLRLQHFYPDAKIIALLPTYTNGYYSNTKLAEANAVLALICDHYGVTYVDLRESGISTKDLPDGIHPDAKGMDYITEAALEAMMAENDLEPGENVVYSIIHQMKHATSSLGYYKGVSQGKTFAAEIAGEDLTITVTMGGVNITETAYSDGVVTIPNVTGNIVIAAEGREKTIYEDHLQQLPAEYYGKNLWKLLEHDPEYFTGTGWMAHSSGNVYSVTVPVTAGEKIYADSFTAAGSNGSSTNGIRVTWFDEDGVLESAGAGAVYEEYAAKGYLTVPEGAVAVCIPMWTNDADWELYIWDSSYDLIHHLGNHLQQLPESVCADVNLWEVLKPENTYYTGTAWGNLSTNQVWSVTFPVNVDTRIWSTSFQKCGSNGNDYSNVDGVRVTWFDEDGIPESVGAGDVYAEFSEKGFLSVPEGAVAVCIPMWNAADHNAIYLLNLEHCYEDGKCLGCGAKVEAEDPAKFGAAVKKADGSTREFETLDEAILASVSGDTVLLLKDATTYFLSVPVDVDFDLNGNTLTAEYVASFGNVIDSSHEKNGLLRVSDKKILLQRQNRQLPVKELNGYRFAEIEKFNWRLYANIYKLGFQPLFEEGSHPYILQGKEMTDVSVGVRISWQDTQGVRSQDFTYKDALVTRFIQSYNGPGTGSFKSMLTLTLSGAENLKELQYQIIVKSVTGVEILSESIPHSGT